MSELVSILDPKTEEAKVNFDGYQAILEKFNQAQSESLALELPSREKQSSRGKLSPRERISKVIDVGTSFFEIGQIAGYKVYEQPLPSAAIVTGVGVINGRKCAIFANDSAVKGGTYYPVTLKKHLRMQSIARKHKLPCIYLVDSGGVFLPLQDDLFPSEHHFGKIFKNIAEMSSLGIAQISAVLGSCTAGGAYIPAMCDETIITKGNGTIFLGGPQLVKAATGVEVDAQSLGGATLHTEVSGVADHYAENEDHALQIVRDLVSRSHQDEPECAPDIAPRDSLYSLEEIPYLLSKDPKKPIIAREILARLLDDSKLVEYKANYGKSIVCGTGHIGGYAAGIIINDGVLFSESAIKATNFMAICAKRKLPIVFIHNINGFMVGKEYEAEGIAKHGAKMVNAISCLRVPTISLIVGGSYGAGNLAMCGRTMEPDFMAMWPNAKTSVVGGVQAAKVMLMMEQEKRQRNGESMTELEQEQFMQPIIDTYEKQGSAMYVGARMNADAIIPPVQTRDWLATCLSLCRHQDMEETNFGIFRM
ncbi:MULTISPECIES: carboxyl transferase domain-containing protein [Vibrio]|uniref:carboxyl transferase domain-containing protein n=1 Tax=Vibrio TaxID=662 RepID=UPI0005F9D2AC|nr:MULTISPECIES: carboxyl transferase domain-containing protein [Vibrio]KJY86873.1 methylcrotonoyl-CoA carboxylase [Vibrio neptunius]MDA0117497.1 methylcrotonoyl-CoA carboxylase [Vibrio sp. T11.5]